MTTIKRKVTAALRRLADWLDPDASGGPQPTV